MDGNVGGDPRRPQKVKTYDFVKDPPEGISSNDVLSFMALIFSVLGLLLKVSICIILEGRDNHTYIHVDKVHLLVSSVLCDDTLL